MTKSEFKSLIKNGLLFLDGATGSNLQKRGMEPGECPELWILDHPNALVELQKEYVAAGSDVVYSPTFTSNRIKLKEYGLEDRIEEINTKLVNLSKEAVAGKAYVAGDITMTGKSLKPVGDMDFEDLVDIYKEQISYLVNAGVDMLVIETMMSLQETRAALIAAKETCDLPVLCTLTFESDGRTLFGSDPKTAAVVLSSLGADAVGANCSTGPLEMVKVISDMASVCEIPIIAKPNAGLPSVDKDGKTVYSLEPEAFGEQCSQLIKAGATVLGGCCGTNPQYIEALKNAAQKIDLPQRNDIDGIRFLASERQCISFSAGDPFIVVGERINPTGKKALQAELKEGKLDIVRDFASSQEEKGARILDINVGMGGIDEKEMMLKVIEEVSLNTSLPLSVDTSPIDVLEAALRRYPGRALVNSVSAESAVMERKLEIAKKYGAMIIVLPLSDEGLPKSLEEKKVLIDKVVNRAYELGFRKEDIVVDGLVTTVGANPKAALEVLETIEYATSRGLASTCGLSNISFGLPQRPFVNTAFLTMAIQKGLTMAIMNPSQDLLMNAAFASDLLMNKEDSAQKYVERMNETEYSVQTSKNDSKAESISNDETDLLYKDVLDGNRMGIVQHTQDALEKGRTPKSILDDSLIKAIDEVGNRFNIGKYFLPQLIASAEAMKSSIEVLEPLMNESNSDENMRVIVMATVKGDIHDIGKNLVSMMLKNHGFKVIDLGKDVSKEDIIKAAIEYKAEIIGLSALMTTTMVEMKNVISYAKEMGVTAKIMVGGAVVTAEYAKEIGADGYSTDAADAVEVAKKLLQ